MNDIDTLITLMETEIRYHAKTLREKAQFLRDSLRDVEKACAEMEEGVPVERCPVALNPCGILQNAAAFENASGQIYGLFDALDRLRAMSPTGLLAQKRRDAERLLFSARNAAAKGHNRRAAETFRDYENAWIEANAYAREHGLPTEGGAALNGDKP